MTQEYEKIIERVARAVCQHEGHDPDKIIAYKSLSAWTLYQSLARAAYAEVLAALSEMIPVLRDAAVQEIVVVGNPPPDSEHQTGSITMGDLAETALRAALRTAPRE